MTSKTKMPNLKHVVVVVAQAWLIGSLWWTGTEAVIVCHDDQDAQLSSPRLLSATANYRMQWKTSATELFVTLSASSTADVKWLGFGFPEQTSAGMAGADVVTVRFNDLGLAEAEDRHVEWQSFPYYPIGDGASYSHGGVSVPTSPSFFPERDCENNGTDDWIILSSERTNECMIVSMKRRFVTQDTNDREVPHGYSKYFWSYGTSSSITYHGGTNRGVESDTFRPDVAPVYQATSLDGTINREFLFNDYLIPQQETTYACKYFNLSDYLDLSNGKQYDVVGFEPVIHPDTKPYVHHMVVFMCPGNAPIPTRVGASECGNMQMESCVGMLFTWGVGAGPLYFPEDVGARVGARSGQFNTSFGLYIQMHYTNLEGVPNLVDQSGARVYFDTNLKKHQMGTLMLGVPGLEWEPLQPKTPDIHRQTTCPSGCTYYFKERVTVFSSLLHMHEFGKKIWTAQYDINGNFKRITNRIDFWSFGNQQLKPVNFTIEPGDRLQTHCVYDTSKWPLQVNFAEETFTEMCFDIITYYPAQFSPDPSSKESPFFNCGAYYNNTDKKSRSICTNRQLSDSYIAQAHHNGWWPDEVKDKFVQIDEPDSADSSIVTEFAKDLGDSICRVTDHGSGDVSSDPEYDFQLNNVGGNNFLWKRTGGNTLKARVEGPPNSWVAWGLTSPDNTGNKMIGAFAVIGMPSTDPFAQGSACGVFQLNGFAVSEIARVAEPNGLISCSYSTSDTESVLTFEASHLGTMQFRGFDKDATRRRLADSAMTQAITAQGPSNAFGQHSNQVAFSVDLATSASSITVSPARILHAIFMFFGFVVFAGTGILAAAAKETMFSKWFVVHRVSMCLAVISTIIGLALIVQQVAVPMRSAHHILGVLAIALMFIQPILGVLRPHLPAANDKFSSAKSLKRTIWEYVHKNNGRLVFVLGVANSILGVIQHGPTLSPPISSPSAVGPIFLSLVGVFAIIFIGLWLRIKLRRSTPHAMKLTVVSDEKQYANA